MGKKLWDLWKRFDPARSFTDLVWNVFLVFTGLSVATVMAWSVAQLTWFWVTFQWAGIIFVGVVTWLLVGIGLNLYRHAPNAEKRPLDPWLIVAGLAALLLIGSLVAYGIQRGPTYAVIAPDPPPETITQPASRQGQPRGNDNPLLPKIEALFAKRGLPQIDWNNSRQIEWAPMGQDSDRAIYFTGWDIERLGPWPTVEDGFTPAELRRSPQPIVRVTKPGPTSLLNRKAEANQETLTILRDEMAALQQRGRQLGSNWWNGLTDPKNHPDFRVQLVNYHQQVSDAHGKLEQIRYRNPEFQDIVSVLDSSPYSEWIGSISAFLSSFEDATQFRPDTGRTVVNRLMGPVEQRHERAIINYNDWRQLALTRTIYIQKRLAE